MNLWCAQRTLQEFVDLRGDQLQLVSTQQFLDERFPLACRTARVSAFHVHHFPGLAATKILGAPYSGVL